MNDDLLKLFIESSNDFIYEIDLASHKITWHNDFAKQLLSYPKNNINTTSKFLEKLTSKDKEKFQERFSENKNGMIHFQIKDFHGKNFIFEDKYIYQDEKIIGILKDISEIKNEIKQVSNGGYKYFFEANKIPILIISPTNGKILDANVAATKFYGFSEQELKQLYIYNINTLDKETVFKEMSLAQKEQRVCFNFKHKIKSGEILDVEVYSGPLKTKDNNLLYSVIFDVTDRKKAQAKLLQANTIYQNTKEAIFISDLKGKFLSVNNSFENALGYNFDELKNKNIDILKSNKHNKSFYRKIEKNLIKFGFWEGEIINKTKEGKLISQWLSINTVYDEFNKAQNYVYVFSDFSKLKEQEKLLRKKDHLMFHQSKMASMGEMLRNIAHHWRQPLSVISVASSSLKLKKELNLIQEEDYEDFFDSIDKSTQYLSNTIEDFTTYFKSENEKTNIYLHEVINKTIKLFKASSKTNDIKIYENIDAKIKICAAKNELVQAILNILTNSKDAYLKRNKKNRAIYISIKRQANNAIIIIEDNAGGIKQEILSKIFDPYFTTKHQSQGTGLGLYMTLEIIQKHLQGKIEVTNLKKLDKTIGTSFKITLPTV